MKTWPLLIGIIVILAFLCSPALAISKSDLISFYKGQSAPTTLSPTLTPTPQTPSWIVTPTPTPVWGPILPFPTPAPRGPILPFPTPAPTPIPIPIFGSIVKPPSSGFIKGKPNIYLYSDRDLVAQVRLAPEYAITVSEPVYQPGKGWRAEIRNGSLNGKGDFLFYEAMGSDFAWQNEEGYIIRAAYREEDLASMLGQYGFNVKETREFIDYWASQLVGDVDFVFYPQETEAVNQDMPLYISPEPDNVMRIWFFAEPLESAPEPVTHPEKIIREGFYIVEWGVIIDDEYRISSPPLCLGVV